MSPDLSRRVFVGAMAGGVVGIRSTAAAAATSAAAAAAVTGPGGEPDVDVAKAWWPNPRNVWTPVGWKDHLFRYNVFYNGTVIGAPCPLGRVTPGVEQYRGRGIQLDMTPWGGWFPSGPLPALYPGHFYVYRDDIGHYGRGNQSWAANPTPVLQTDWPQSNGTVLRQSVFAHKLGGGDISSGTEPLFAWIRLSVEYVNPLHTSGQIGFAIRAARPYYTQEYPYTFQDGVTLTGYPEMAPFPEGRWVVPVTVGNKRGIKMWQPDGPRLAAVTTGTVPTWSQPDTSKFLYNIEVRLPAVKGAYTDVMVAMLAQFEPDFDRELALGYDGALADSDSYWSHKPSTAAVIDTPETHVNEAIRRNIQISEVVAQKTPGTGHYTFLTGSYGYDVLWSTPTSMVSHMFFDLLGYHDVVAKHIDLFRAEQGTIKPPGAAYPLHPGYYSTPSNLQSIDWITDHGAIMQTVATHALMTGNQSFIDTWLPSLVKACDFIKDACANNNHNGVRGLPPPAVATDEGLETQSVWNMGWLYKGFTTTIRLLAKVNHPRTAEFTSVAAGFKSVFNQAFDAYGARQPKWTHPDGQQYPVYSQNLIDTPEGPFGEIVRLDAGPMVLVWAGLIDATDVRMVKFADYFRHGPNIKLYGDGTRKNALDRPILLHEISSCEPIYSWNVFHSWQAGNRARYLEGMYSLLIGGMSPQTYVPFEHRDGMSAALGTQGTATWMLRHAVVDDSIVNGELHLLRMCVPLGGQPGQRTLFQAMPTIHGPVSLRFRRTSDSQATFTWSGAWRQRPTRAVVHAPPGISTLVVNGTSYAVPSSRQVVVPVP